MSFANHCILFLLTFLYRGLAFLEIVLHTVSFKVLFGLNKYLSANSSHIVSLHPENSAS